MRSHKEWRTQPSPMRSKAFPNLSQVASRCQGAAAMTEPRITCDGLLTIQVRKRLSDVRTLISWASSLASHFRDPQWLAVLSEEVHELLQARKITIINMRRNTMHTVQAPIAFSKKPIVPLNRIHPCQTRSYEVCTNALSSRFNLWPISNNFRDTHVGTATCDIHVRFVEAKQNAVMRQGVQRMHVPATMHTRMEMQD